MIYRISHTTTYDYSSSVTLCHNLAHLTPRETAWQRCQETSLQVSPLPAVEDAHVDYFGNPVIFFTVQEPHRQLVVKAEHSTEVEPRPQPDRFATLAWELVRQQLATSRDSECLDAYQYVFDSPYIRTSAELAGYAEPSFWPARPILDAVLDLTARIHADFHYDPKATTLSTTLAEVLTGRRGVCQDFAHLQIGCLRSLGLAARYVSGYLLTQPAEGQARPVGADASHAWLSVWCPGTGWVDVDPTNNLIPVDRHILLGWGRDYDDVSPIKGVILGGGDHRITVGVDVTRNEDAEIIPGSQA
jgi:transglutaminase-like putative cysteine protease